MKVRFERVKFDQASERLRLSLVREPVSELALDCALLRALLWGLSSAGAQSTHTLKLLNAASHSALWYHDREEHKRREFLRAALDEMSLAYDVAQLPGGYWLPAPLRQIKIDNEEWLIVGGIPSGLLTKVAGARLFHHGPFRRSNEALRKELKVPTEALERWLAEPLGDIQAWAREIMQNTPLSKYEQQADGARFRIYNPSAKTGIQFSRWVESSLGLPGGNYLAYRDSFGGIGYRIVKVDVGSICATGVPLLAEGEARRLLYGLDLITGNPVEVNTTSTKDAFRITLKSELPRAELRLFAALGHLSFPTKSFYPRVWTFEPKHKAQVEARLKALGVRLSA